MIIERIIQLNSPDIAMRLAAEDILIGAGSAAHDALFEAGRSDETERRWRAAALLGDVRAWRALDLLTHLLADETWEVRASAVYALGILADERGWDALQRAAFHTSPDEQTPYIAALGLLRIDPTRARALLEEACSHPDEPIRRTALSALAYARWMNE
jgi:HEAT repeat protein